MYMKKWNKFQVLHFDHTFLHAEACLLSCFNYFGSITSCLCHVASFLLKLFWLHDILHMSCSSFPAQITLVPWHLTYIMLLACMLSYFLQHTSYMPYVHVVLFSSDNNCPLLFKTWLLKIIYVCVCVCVSICIYKYIHWPLLKESSLFFSFLSVDHLSSWWALVSLSLSLLLFFMRTLSCFLLIIVSRNLLLKLKRVN